MSMSKMATKRNDVNVVETVRRARSSTSIEKSFMADYLDAGTEFFTKCSYSGNFMCTHPDCRDMTYGLIGLTSKQAVVEHYARAHLPKGHPVKGLLLSRDEVKRSATKVRLANAEVDALKLSVLELEEKLKSALHVNERLSCVQDAISADGKEIVTLKNQVVTLQAELAAKSTSETTTTNCVDLQDTVAKDKLELTESALRTICELTNSFVAGDDESYAWKLPQYKTQAVKFSEAALASDASSVLGAAAQLARSLAARLYGKTFRALEKKDMFVTQ